jgi:hypothetical protein
VADDDFANAGKEIAAVDSVADDHDLAFGLGSRAAKSRHCHVLLDYSLGAPSLFSNISLLHCCV